MADEAISSMLILGAAIGLRNGGANHRRNHPGLLVVPGHH